LSPGRRFRDPVVRLPAVFVPAGVGDFARAVLGFGFLELTGRSSILALAGPPGFLAVVFLAALPVLTARAGLADPLLEFRERRVVCCVS
jgi:hypothetical protein